jgi:hypothetical protein
MSAITVNVVTTLNSSATAVWPANRANRAAAGRRRISVSFDQIMHENANDLQNVKTDENLSQS